MTTMNLMRTLKLTFPEDFLTKWHWHRKNISKTTTII